MEIYTFGPPPKKNRVNRLLRHIAKYFLPVLFISYIGCISLFTHTHVVNGVTIVHSHPYKPEGHHSHTTTEFQLIHILSHLTTSTPSVGVVFAAVSIAFVRTLYPCVREALPSVKWKAHGLRAPPVSIL